MKKLTEEQLEKNRRINKKLLPIIIAIFTFLIITCCIGTCSDKKDNQKKQESITVNNIKEELESKVNEIENFSNMNKEWISCKNGIPSFEKYEHLKNYSFEEISYFYRMLQIEYFNKKGSIDARLDDAPDKLAEQKQISKYVFLEVKTYFSKFYEYCREFNKNYFNKNEKLFIKPNYYASISSTAYIGNFTFNCSLNFGKINKNDIEEKINEKIEWLKLNIPEFYDGFRIMSISYIDDVTDVNKTYDFSYIYRKRDSILKKMNYGCGSFGKELPENEKHWWMDGWNDLQKLAQLD